MTDRYLSPEGAASYLQTTTHALYKRVARKQIPYTRIGRSLLFDKVKLDLWLERRATMPGVKRGQHSKQEDAA